MLQEKLGPAQLTTARPRNVISSAAIYPEYNPASLDFQRSRAISRRISLPASIAAIVAHLAFGEVRQ